MPADLARVYGTKDPCLRERSRSIKGNEPDGILCSVLPVGPPGRQSGYARASTRASEAMEVLDDDTPPRARVAALGFEEVAEPWTLPQLQDKVKVVG